MSFLFEPSRFKVAYGGRAGGKSWGIARALVLLGAQRKLRILCAREIQTSIRESVHQVVEKQIEELGFSALYDIQRDKIMCPATGTEFIFIGLRHNVANVKSYEDVDIVWVEEADKVSKGSWRVLTPTIRKPAPGGPFGLGAEIWISFNPEFEEDYTYQNFVLRPPSDAIVRKVSFRDNPYFPENLRTEMEDCKARDMDEYLHVWEGHCRQVLDGAVFAKELRAATKDGRITHVPYDPSVGVDVVFDLGRSDHTSMWFGQQVGWEQHLIDFEQDRHEHIDYYLRLMQGKGYVIDTVWLPHDAKAKTIGTKMSVEEQVRAKGYRVRIVPRMSVADKLNAGRTVFGACYFDESKCSDGLHSLRKYRYEIKDGSYSLNPLHDEFSDAADAFCYFGISRKLGRRGVLEGGQMTAGGMVRQKIDDLMERFVPGGSTGWMAQ